MNCDCSNISRRTLLPMADLNARWSCHSHAPCSLVATRTPSNVPSAARSTYRYACATPGSNSAASALDNLGGPSIALMASSDAAIIISDNQAVINYHRLPTAAAAAASTRCSRPANTRLSGYFSRLVLTCESILHSIDRAHHISVTLH